MRQTSLSPKALDCSFKETASMLIPSQCIKQICHLIPFHSLVVEFPVSSQSGRGWCRPAVSGLRAGLCVAFEGLQFPREAWTALRWASLCVIENPAFPSSWDKTTSTCLRERKTTLHSHPSMTGSSWSPLMYGFILLMSVIFVTCVYPKHYISYSFVL